MKTAYLDAQNGASGDMFLAALVDGGCPVERIAAALADVVPAPFRLDARPVERAGARCTRIEVEIRPEAGRYPDGTTLAGVRDHVAASPLAGPLKAPSLRVLDRLNEAESRARGKAPDAIRLPGEGAADLVIDVVGTVAGLDALGITTLHASPLRPGQGPAVPPSVLELARGWTVLSGGPAREITTPTGAALVTTLAGPAAHPPMVLDRAGYGAGTWEGRDGDEAPWPNYLRLWIGEVAPWERDAVWELSTNLDSFNPEGTDLLFERLFAAGAVDVWLTPVQMKKSRPGILLTALADGAAVEAVERVLFAETPTLGIRRTLAQREKLPRRFETVDTPHGPVRFKIAGEAREEKAAPEFEDLRRIAVARGLPLPGVREAAEAAWRARNHAARGTRDAGSGPRDP